MQAALSQDLPLLQARRLPHPGEHPLRLLPRPGSTSGQYLVNVIGVLKKLFPSNMITLGFPDSFPGGRCD